MLNTNSTCPQRVGVISLLDMHAIYAKQLTEIEAAFNNLGIQVRPSSLPVNDAAMRIDLKTIVDNCGFLDFKMTKKAAERFLLHFTINEMTEHDLGYAQRDA
jgi:hypothetical protein